jgi:hypothetical protein
METPAHPSDPNAPPELLILTKALVAQSQLEAAITLWFNYGDPISIHALAVAAQDCYSAMSSNAGKKSKFGEWLKSRPKGFQDRARYVQNFIKHGWKNLTGQTKYMPILGEALILDAIECHENVFGKKTHLMTLFIARFLLERPGTAIKKVSLAIQNAANVYDFTREDRTQFFNKRINK